MLKMALANGVARPRLACDWCGEWIYDAADGCQTWQVAAETATAAGALHVTHRRCQPAFAAARGGAWQTDDLARLPVQLATDLALDWRKTKEWLNTLS